MWRDDQTGLSYLNRQKFTVLISSRPSVHVHVHVQHYVHVQLYVHVHVQHYVHVHVQLPADSRVLQVTPAAVLRAARVAGERPSVSS